MKFTGMTRVAILLAASALLRGGVVFETTSAYHSIRVVDDQGRRTLLFNRSEESRMSLVNPLEGHFEYVEYFLLPPIWNPAMTNVLMIGLGGASAQRLYSRYCTNVTIHTVEIDPAVRQVARDYFLLEEGPRQRVFLEDGRQFLRRSSTRYGAILLDAYTEGRYGASLPHHLVTKEFFQLARDRLEPDGVLAYNVMGSMQGWRADIVGSLYRTMKSVFPQVYLCAARESQNVVLLGISESQPALTTRTGRASPPLPTESGAQEVPPTGRAGTPLPAAPAVQETARPSLDAAPTDVPTSHEPPQERGLQSAGSHASQGTSLRAEARAPHRFMAPGQFKQEQVALHQRARAAYATGAVLLPTLGVRLGACRLDPPPGHQRCPVLTDDYAPVDGLLSEGRPLLTR